MKETVLADHISSQTVDSDRLRVHYLSAGPEDGTPVIFVHGNLSSSLLWDETLAAMPDGYRLLAIDMRGFGDSEKKEIDATRGMRDFADDLRSFVRALAIDEPVHLVGHSTGGGAIMQYTIDHPADVLSLTLVASVSPYGFGGTKDADGTPVGADFAGAGAGTIAPELVERLQKKDRSDESQLSPRNVMNTFYWKTGFRVSKAREDAFVDAMLKTEIGDDNFPGDAAAAEGWPGVGPGTRGVNNALTAKYTDLTGLIAIDPKPPILWIHGTDDMIVGDNSMFDIAVLGQLGAVPGYPGAEAYPAQPMKQQMRAVLQQYEANGGTVSEVEIADSGHSPYIDQPQQFQQALIDFLNEQE